MNINNIQASKQGLNQGNNKKLIWTDVWYETLLLWVSSLKSIQSAPKTRHLRYLYEASLAV